MRFSYTDLHNNRLRRVTHEIGEEKKPACLSANRPSVQEERIKLSSGLGSLRSVHDAEGAAALRPDQDERVLTLGNARQSLLHVRHIRNWLAVHANDHVPRLQPGIIGCAPR